MTQVHYLYPRPKAKHIRFKDRPIYNMNTAKALVAILLLSGGYISSQQVHADVTINDVILANQTSRANENQNSGATTATTSPSPQPSSNVAQSTPTSQPSSNIVRLISTPQIPTSVVQKIPIGYFSVNIGQTKNDSSLNENLQTGIRLIATPEQNSTITQPREEASSPIRSLAINKLLSLNNISIPSLLSTSVSSSNRVSLSDNSNSTATVGNKFNIVSMFVVMVTLIGVTLGIRAYRDKMLSLRDTQKNAPKY